MAPSKRKRPFTRTTSNKRPQYTQPDTDSCSGDSSSADEPEVAQNSEEEWEALRILSQTGKGFGLKYLIEWAGIDPATGNRWDPTWEKAAYASKGLRDSWNEERARQARAKEQATSAAKEGRGQRGASKATTAQTAQARGARRRPIVESPEASSSEPESDSPTQTASSATTTPRSAAIEADADWTSPRLSIGGRSDSSESSPHTEVPESSGESPTETTDLHSSELFVSQPAFRASGVVLDTQSSAGDVSYIPVTQEELESSLHSEADYESEDHVVSYLGLLKAPTLGARAHSPATSVAETVADTTQDLHSLRQSESQQEQSKTTSSSETPELSATTVAPPPTDSSCHHQSNPASAVSHSDVGPPTPFVENTTQFDHEESELSIQQPQPPTRGTAVVLAPTERRPGTANFDAQLLASSTPSEPCAIAETPQASQLSHTLQQFVPNEEPQDPGYQPDSVHTSLEDQPEVSLTEVSVLEDNAQFPFHSQYPISFDPRPETESIRGAFIEPSQSYSIHRVEHPRLSQSPHSNTDQHLPALNESEESTTIDEISQPGQSLPDLQSFSSLESAATQDRGYSVGLEGSAVKSQRPLLSDRSTTTCEHNAQIYPPSAFSDTPADSSVDIRATVEADLAEVSGSKHSSPCSRHDSSQETPERQFYSIEQISSPIPHPPSYSLLTCDSNVPPRPTTPTATSPNSRMAGSTAESGAEFAARRLREEQEAALAALRRPKRNNASAEGTRSPSTVPDRPPAPPAQTSLRTVAFANAKDKATESLLENPLAATSKNTDAGPSQEKASLVAAVAAAAVAAPSGPEPSLVEPTDDHVEDMSDVDQGLGLDDNGSVYDDDLDLEQGEYIVPLFIEGRQRDTYIQFLEQKSDVLDKFLDGSVKDLAPAAINELDRVLKRLKDIETHPDLTYAEAESATSVDMQQANDVEYGAQFGIDNSVKFKFLSELFNQLRQHEMHVVLLLEHGNVALINILRTFLTAAAHNYSILDPRYESNASDDTLKITVFSMTKTPVLRPVDLIICLDGLQSAARIRQSHWAKGTGKVPPVIHLVIPQTVGHLEYFVHGRSTKEKRIDLILSGLSQIHERNEVGSCIDIDTPNAAQSARLIASWLAPQDDDEDPQWPLPSIGSMANYFEAYGTQQSVGSAPSSPVPERAKRPLETDDYESAKRLRYTPQSGADLASSAAPDPEITRVSDSVPGTAAAENARLAAALKSQNAEHLRVLNEYREERIMWDEQQTQHENREQQHRKLLNEKSQCERALETMTRNNERLRNQLEAQAAEKKHLREELEAQRNLGLNSANEKDVEITRLRQELETANIERNKALNSVKSTEATLEYTKEQYRNASNTAGQLQTNLSSLERQNETLAHQASGEVAKVKSLHLDTTMKNMMQQNSILRNENAQLKTTLKQREEELVRAKNNSGRAAYGTRGQSTTPQPKIRSRAASPERGARAPRGGGRISNLVAEER